MNRNSLSGRGRIVHLTSVHPPFDTRIFHKECRSLVRAGYAVTLVAPHERNEAVDGVQIAAVHKTSRRLRRMTTTVAQVYRRAVQLDADLYHFHDPELIPVCLLLRARDRRVIYDIHEDVPRSLFAPSRDYLPAHVKRPLSWLIEHLENLAARQFSALVAATPAIGWRFQVLNPHTKIISNFPIPDELASPAGVAWDKRSFSVAYVGAIALERGLRQMVEAMAYLPDHLQARLKLAGDFSPPQHRDGVVNLLGWQRVDELGFADRSQVAHLLGQVRAGLVLFHPDPNHIQAQPNKMFEYMAAGIPVIASDFPLWRDLIEGTECGLVVNPLKPGEIAGAIEFVLTHPDEAEAMGRRGREAVETRYNWESEASKLLRLYADLLPGDAA